MTADEIIELYERGMSREAIALATGESRDRVYRIIGALLEKRRQDRLNAILAQKRKPEVFQVEYGGRTWYDVTDLFTDRPCICHAPMKEERE